jgi:hypothetical protein
MLNATAGANTGIGYLALNGLAAGTQNVGIGYGAAQLTGAGADNIAIGVFALYGNTTGSYNVAIGTNAGRFQADGATALIPGTSVYVGCGAKGLNNSDANSIVIGYNAIGEGANTTVIGSAGTTLTHLYGAVKVGGTAGATITSGTGAPSFSASKGSLYFRTDGGAATCLYVNESGSTTWVAK